MSAVRRIRRMRGIAWVKLSILDCWAVLKMTLRSKLLIGEDFPVGLGIAKGITKNDVVLELGPNTEGTTRKLAGLAQSVHSFEPVLGYYKWLVRNTKAALNRITMRVWATPRAGWS